MSDGNEARQPPGPGWWLASDDNWYPPPNTAPPGWYEVPGERGRRCYWDGNQWAPWVGRPGWHDVPGSPGERRYWDGWRWTERYRRRPSRWLFVAFVALSLLGVATLAWGYTVAFREPEPSQVVNCEGSQEQTVTGEFITPLWVPWSLLIGLAVTGAVVVALCGRGDWRWWLLLSMPAWSAVIVTFPPWWLLLSGMNCGL